MKCSSRLDSRRAEARVAPRARVFVGARRHPAAWATKRAYERLRRWRAKVVVGKSRDFTGTFASARACKHILKLKTQR